MSDPGAEVSEVLIDDEVAEEQPEHEEIEEQEEMSFDFDNPPDEGEDEGEPTGDELNPESPDFNANKAFKNMHGQFTRVSQELAELRKSSPKSEELEALQQKAQQFDALATPNGRKALRSLISGDEEQQDQLSFLSIPDDPLDKVNPTEFITEDNIPVFEKLALGLMQKRLAPYVQKMEANFEKTNQIEQVLLQAAQHQQKAQVTQLATDMGTEVDADLSAQIDKLTQAGLTPKQALFALRGEQLIEGKKQVATKGKQRASLASPQIAGTSQKARRKPLDLEDLIMENAKEQGFKWGRF